MMLTIKKILNLILSFIIFTALISCNIINKKQGTPVIITQNQTYTDSSQITFSTKDKPYHSESNETIINENILEPRTWVPEISELNKNEINLDTFNESNETIYNISPILINPGADTDTKRLMTFLCDIYGRYILTGQFTDTPKSSPELEVIKKITNREPALIGFDMIDYSPSRTAFGAVSSHVLNAIEWSKKGGIVTFSWHWNAPLKYLLNSDEFPWWKGFYAEATNIDLTKIMNGEDPDGYNLILSDIDAIAECLKILQDAGVPILWRPLHESGGSQFWWSSFGDESYISLWKLMYSRLTYYHKINNLIWVWNGKGLDRYPGHEYVDIISMDSYAAPRDYSSQISTFTKASDISSGNKIIALAENGVIPSVNNIFTDNGIWSWFMVWGGEFITIENKYNQKYTEKEVLYDMYNHTRSITLDELPDLKKYPVRN